MVWTILLFSTCGESLFLVTKYIRLRRLIAQHPDHSVILAHASLCISKFVYTSVFFIVGWTALNALVSQNIYFKYVDWLTLDTVHALNYLYPSDLPSSRLPFEGSTLETGFWRYMGWGTGRGQGTWRRYRPLILEERL